MKGAYQYRYHEGDIPQSFVITLVVGVLGIGPDTLLAALMYLTIIFTLLASYS